MWISSQSKCFQNINAYKTNFVFIEIFLILFGKNFIHLSRGVVYCWVSTNFEQDRREYLRQYEVLYWQDLSRMKALVISHKHGLFLDEITHSCPNLNGDLTKLSLKSDDGWINDCIPPFCKDARMYLIIYTLKFMLVELGR